MVFALCYFEIDIKEPIRQRREGKFEINITNNAFFIERGKDEKVNDVI